ncbi:amidohydrolase family protein [Labilibaculum antarcticum]|uniref:Amidohydrolase n=1 Tax=Labilibaculum antarcticum TaxID=1717717 RepID=A0A1Y1CEF2_9BACT|nr:amidohydrolase family protein [Labilibaculum antarcticum]BAX78493.1 amidohydrolase [Labilibaculum antarcticum]
MKVQKVDSHQHFWNYCPEKHSWLSDEMAVLKNDFAPKDLLKNLQAIDFDACVAVQADQTEGETDFLIELANQNPFIKGVVGWVDFRADNLRERLVHYSKFPALKGFRHVVQDEPDDNFLLGEKFCNGIAMLEEFGFTYDILIFAKHLGASADFVAKFPNQKFVLDHIAKPEIKDQKIEAWAEGIQKLASFPNVSCKLSGIVTEADWTNWTESDIIPYLNVVFNAFGAERLMIGSDWPVCTLAGSYQKVMNLIIEQIKDYTASEQEAILGGNAIKFYQLNK